MINLIFFCLAISLNSSSGVKPQMCDLDWNITYHNDDGDGCRDVSVQVNSLIGDCSNCQIIGYTVWLDFPDFDRTIAIVSGGNGGPNNLAEIYTHEDSNGLQVGGSTAVWQSLQELGAGEKINIDYYVGVAKDIPLCLDLVYSCDDGSEHIMHVCKNVDLLCF